jgi:hypothetical protein
VNVELNCGGSLVSLIAVYGSYWAGRCGRPPGRLLSATVSLGAGCSSPRHACRTSSVVSLQEGRRSPTFAHASLSHLRARVSISLGSTGGPRTINPTTGPRSMILPGAALAWLASKYAIADGGFSALQSKDSPSFRSTGVCTHCLASLPVTITQSHPNPASMTDPHSGSMCGIQSDVGNQRAAAAAD